jgi:hypothetical protein
MIDIEVDPLVAIPMSASFTPGAWPMATPSERYAMTSSLLRFPDLVSLDKNALFAMLGPPDGEVREVNYEDRKNESMEEILCVHLVLDENEVVTSQYMTDY